MARLAAVAVAALMLTASAAEARTLSWSGRSWYVRQSNGLEGPGPNVFDSSAKSVWVDARGYLHMKVRKQGRGWVSSEIFTQEALGLGKYTWVAEVPAALDPNVTVGLFTYLDDTHELDIELAKWGDAADPNNAQYAVQPAVDSAHLQRFALPPGAATLSYVWSPASLAFSGGPTWSYANPLAFSAPVHINVWQFRGLPPADGRDVEVVIRSFSYTP